MTLRQRFIGYLMLATVVFLWVGSSVTVQMIFEDVQFEQPVFITLFNSASSTCLLLPRIAARSRCCCCGGTDLEVHDDEKGRWRPPSDGADCSPLQILRLSASVGLLWLTAGFLFNMSLERTSVATNTVLSSSSSVFTFVFSVLFGGETFRWWSFGASAFSFLGCMVVITQTPTSTAANAVPNDGFGCALALLSACTFACVSVMLQKLAPKDLDVSAWIGMNGLLALCLSPGILFVAHVGGLEAYRTPTGRTFGCLLVNALVGCTFANYLYSSSLLLLSPLVATVGVSLTIPVSALADEVVLKQHSFSTTWVGGALLVVAGVVLAAADMGPEGEEDGRRRKKGEDDGPEAEMQSLLGERGDDREESAGG